MIRISKKGTESISFSLKLIQILIIIFFFIFLPVFAFIINIISSEYFEKNYLATDLALVADTLLASPNDVIYNYQEKTKDFTFEIRKNEIRVYKKNRKTFDLLLGSIGKYFFIENPSVKTYYEEIAPIYSVSDKKSEIDIPVKISIIKDSNSIRFYNSKEELINE